MLNRVNICSYMKNIICIKFLWLAVLILLQVKTEAQNHRKQLESIGIVLPTDRDLARTIYEKLPQEYKTSALKENSCYFSAISANDYIEELYMGEDYKGWTEYEEYLNQIFKNIAPPEVANNQMFRIRITQNGYYNAEMSSGGIMNINIGLFDNLQDEATLAGIMAHELSHYLLCHSIKGYLSYKRGDFNSIFSLSDKLINRYSAKLEYQADSMAAALINQSPYALQGLVQGFDLMALVERKREALKWEKIDYNDETHPDPKLRKQKILELHSKYGNKNGNLYLVSQELFVSLKNKAKLEILDCLLRDFRYDDCTEKAFKYHLLDPANPIYPKYIAESIRRNCYGDLKLWTENFITYRYFESNEKGNHRTRSKKTLFHTFNPDILLMNEDEIAAMKANFYWDGTERFTTNEEAFNYFVKVGSKFKEPEILLTNALSYTRDTASRKYYLEKYLSNNNIAFPEYARFLLKDSLESILPNRKLVVLANFASSLKIGKNELQINTLSFDTSFMATQILDGIKVVSDTVDYLLMSNLMYTDMDKYNTIKFLLFDSFKQSITFGERVYPQIFDPNYWYLFKDMGVNKIEFVIFSYFGNENKTSDPEQYWQYASSTIPECITNTSKFKVMDLALSEINISTGKKKDSFYVRTNLDLPNNAQSVDEIIKTIKSHRAIFEKANLRIQ